MRAYGVIQSMSDVTTFDFGDGKGAVPAHRHKNPDGTLGGWVADTAHVEETVFVAPTALVYDEAYLRDYVYLFEGARVSGETWLSGSVWVGREGIEQ